MLVFWIDDDGGGGIDDGGGGDDEYVVGDAGQKLLRGWTKYEKTCKLGQTVQDNHDKEGENGICCYRSN